MTSNCACPGAMDTAMWEQLDHELGALRHSAVRGKPKDTSPACCPSSPARFRLHDRQAIKVDGGLAIGDYVTHRNRGERP